MCGNKFLCQWLWHSFAKLCTKNYENPSIFVKVTAKKSVAPFFWTRCSGLNTYGLNGLWKGDEHPAYAPSDYGPPFDHLPLLTDVSCVWPCSLLCFFPHNSTPHTAEWNYDVITKETSSDNDDKDNDEEDDNDDDYWCNLFRAFHSHSDSRIMR